MTSNKLEIKNQFCTFIFIFNFFFLLFNLAATEVFAQSPTASISAQPNDSTPSTSVRDKVRQTIENLVRKPRAIIGTLDQVTDSTLAIKTKAGKSQMVATSASTTYSKLTSGHKSDIKFQDLAIGDFTIAMGYKNGNDILEAKRVLTLDKPPTSNRRALFGTIQNTTKNSLTVKAKNGEVWTIQLTNKTKLTAPRQQEIKSTDISENERLVVVGILDDKKDKTLKATRIHVLSTIPAKPSPSPKPSPKASPTP